MKKTLQVHLPLTISHFTLLIRSSGTTVAEPSLPFGNGTLHEICIMASALLMFYRGFVPIRTLVVRNSFAGTRNTDISIHISAKYLKVYVQINHMNRSKNNVTIMFQEIGVVLCQICNNKTWVAIMELQYQDHGKWHWVCGTRSKINPHELCSRAVFGEFFCLFKYLIRKSKDYVYGIWVYKVKKIW